MPRGVKKGAVAKRGPKAHTLAKPLPHGEVLTDITKKGHWKLLQPIGQGGFGLIYNAQAMHETSNQKNDYVIKLEPHQNGPLYCELNFFRRAGKLDMINAHKKKHSLSHLGVPHYVTSGLHNQKENYRFMVMPKYGSDLQKLFEENNNVFSEATVYNVALQLIDALEYIHENDFVHADIKASNILLSGKDKVFLVDYGLAARYSVNDHHKEYKEDPRKAHDGTIEFTSRDAHKGVAPSRRGDLEILAYCLLQWLCSRLPWEDKLTDKAYVGQQKLKYMDDLNSLFKKCFGSSPAPAPLKQFFDLVVKMDYAAKPDYGACRNIFKKALKNLGCSVGKLDFSSKKGSNKLKRSSSAADIDAESTTPSPKVRKTAAATNGTSEQATPRNPTPARATSKRATPKQATRKKLTPARATPKKASPRITISVKPKKKQLVKAKSPAVSNYLDALPKAYKAPTKNSTDDSKKASAKRTAVLKVSEGTQTSPGLKGLKRSRKGGKS